MLPHLDRVNWRGAVLAEDRAETGELVQETFARAYAAFGPTPPSTNVKAWLFRILVSAAAGSGPGQGAAAGGIGSGPPPPRGLPARDGVSPAEIRAVLRLPGPVVMRALRQLPPDFQLVVYLADVEGLACREIADVMAAPVETVRRRLRCGRCQLRELLRDHAATGNPGPAAYESFATRLRLPAEPPR